MFITFEGIDGAGKTTQIESLAQKINTEFPGKEILITREPGGTNLGTRLRHEILHSDAIAPETELFLYLADRSEHVSSVILPALKRGAIVISDRFADSTVAYQVAGRCLDAELISMMNSFATNSLEPHLTIFLDISATLSRERVLKSAQNSRKNPDRLEREKTEFFEKVRSEFLNIAVNNPDRSLVIDATLSPNEISSQIFKEFKKKFEQLGKR